MRNDTDIVSNWLAEEKFTEVFGSNNDKITILSNLGEEIAYKAQEIEAQYSFEESKDSNPKFQFTKHNKFELEWDNLPLYFPQPISAKNISAFLNHTQNTQRWIGYIIEITDRIFIARLEDITNPGTYEIGTFTIDQDAKDEEEMVQLGAVFYLSVGYNVSKGTYAKQKLIRFQRLSEWTESDFNTAMDRADRISSNLIWE